MKRELTSWASERAGIDDVSMPKAPQRAACRQNHPGLPCEVWADTPGRVCAKDQKREAGTCMFPRHKRTHISLGALNLPGIRARSFSGTAMKHDIRSYSQKSTDSLPSVILGPNSPDILTHETSTAREPQGES